MILIYYYGSSNIHTKAFFNKEISSCRHTHTYSPGLLAVSNISNSFKIFTVYCTFMRYRNMPAAVSKISHLLFIFVCVYDLTCFAFLCSAAESTSIRVIWCDGAFLCVAKCKR